MASSSSEITNTGTQQVDIVPPQDNIPVEEPGKDGLASTTIESLTPGLYKELPSSLEIRRHQVRGRGIWSKRDFKRGMQKILINDGAYRQIIRQYSG